MPEADGLPPSALRQLHFEQIDRSLIPAELSVEVRRIQIEGVGGGDVPFDDARRRRRYRSRSRVFRDEDLNEDVNHRHELSPRGGRLRLLSVLMLVVVLLLIRWLLR
jgi:hypothetical protein